MLLMIIITGVLVIPKQQQSEQIDLRTYSYPFKDLVWASVLGCTTLIIILRLLTNYRNSNLLEVIWTSFAANFGGTISENITGSTAYKVVTFVMLFCGNWVWMGYQASLTVDLSIPDKELPFNDLESFLLTDWNLFTVDKRYFK